MKLLRSLLHFLADFFGPIEAEIIEGRLCDFHGWHEANESCPMEGVAA